MKKILSVFIVFTLIFSISCLSLKKTEASEIAEAKEHVSAEEIYDSNDEDLCNDELLQEYIDFELGISDEPLFGAVSSYAAAHNLEGLNLKIYYILKGKIEKVAAGELFSTEFELTKEDLGFPVFWTAAELGVASIVVDGSIAEDAMNKAVNKLGIKTEEIVRSLLADCPYELYWYDKVAGTELSSLSITAKYDYNLGEYVLGYENGTTFNFSVAGDYASGKYATDPSVIGSVNSAISNAQKIVENNTDKEDIDKLASYRRAITDRVSYNSQAAAGGVAYGNPWQIIWVFDDDPKTNVVCEGYSKAFQYLCTLSTFKSSEIKSRLVWGQMQGGTGAGGHMWNLVTMDDGLNYLVDVTNCDSGTVGADDLLFLAGATAGNTNEGYVLTAGENQISYVYHSDMYKIYSEKELKLAGGVYPYKGSGESGEISGGSGENKGDDTSGESDVNGENEQKSENKSETVTIAAANVKLAKTTAVYTGKAIKPAVTVTVNGKALKSGTDYTVSYKNNKTPGTASVTVKGKGSFTGTVKKTFKINPKGTSVSKLNAFSKGFTVKWKKQAKESSGYQIQYSTSKTFKSGIKTVTVKKTGTTSKKISKLKAKKIYYVRIRTFKTVNGKKFYSSWSAVKKIKTK